MERSSQLLGKDDDGIRLYQDLQEDGVNHVVLAFGKGHHPAVSTVAGVGVDSGTYSMVGTGTFGCGQGFLPLTAFHLHR